MLRLSSVARVTAALSLTLSACAMEVGDPADINSDERADPAFESSLRKSDVLEHLFQQAADEFQVPVELLKAISYAETRWEMVAGTEELEGFPAANGLMALRGDALSRGAALAGVSEDKARSDSLANLRAAAAALSQHATELGIDRSSLGAWAPAVAEMSAIADPESLAHYVHDEVYEALRTGAVAYTPEGELSVRLEPVKDLVAEFPQPRELFKAAGPDYSEAVWRPSPNYSSRPSGDIGDPAMVIIHTCEGTYAGCWGWLANAAARVSAHYVVKEDGSEVSQLVREADKAWHIAANYQCNNNSSTDCWRNGYSSNNFTIGIEHAGYASQSSFPIGQIDTSAKLVCDITRDNNIPRDSFHIVGHGKLQPYNRTDPGPNWPWNDYLDRVRSYCNDGGTGGTGGGTGGGTDGGTGISTITIDSNNNNNDASRGYIEVSGNWNASANVSGYYGTGYWWASTESVSDGASFWFYLPSDASMTVEAWWSAAWDRSSNAPFVMFDAQGNKLDTVYVNQQTNGGKWNTLGTFQFKAGWNKVLLSRWTGTGSVVVADAVRIR